MNQPSKTRQPSLDTVGGRIQAVRMARRLTVTKAAEETGVSRTSFALWEKDEINRMDPEKLGVFAGLTEVSLGWLLDRRGNDPDIFATPGKMRGVVQTGATVPEITAPLRSGGNEQFPKSSRALWTIPRDVLELSFEADPDAVVLKRFALEPRLPNETLARGDYLLIDVSRNTIKEPGIYYLSVGDTPRRAIVAREEGGLVIRFADHPDTPHPVDGNSAPVLGRVMGVFHSV